MQFLKANFACLASLLQRSSTRTGEKNEISFIQIKENKMIRCNFLRLILPVKHPYFNEVQPGLAKRMKLVSFKLKRTK